MNKFIKRETKRAMKQYNLSDEIEKEIRKMVENSLLAGPKSSNILNMNNSSL